MADNALNQAWKGLTDAIKWMAPQPVSPVPPKHTLAEPGGFKQAVNNVTANLSFQPQLARSFPQEGIGQNLIHTTKDLVNRIIPGQPFGNTLTSFTPQPTKPIGITPTVTPGAIPQQPRPLISLQDLLANAQKLIGAQATPTAIPTATPTPTPSGPTREQYIQAMQAVIPEIYKGETKLPVTDYAAYIYDETSKYPIFQKYPFLPIAQAILESSGFKNYSTPKKALGWGARVPDADYNPKTLEEVIADYASALGGRNAEEEKKKYPGGWQKRMSTAGNYQNFRDTGDIQSFANLYAPKSDNPEHGGDVYAGRLQYLMDLYQNQLKDIINNKQIASRQ